MSEDYSGAVKVAADALAAEVFEGSIPGSWSAAIVDDATAIVKALAAAGLLLPEGARCTSEWVFRWYLADQTFIEWGCDSLERAREAALEPPSGAVRGEIRRQDIYTTPWSVVEPVAIQGADSV